MQYYFLLTALPKIGWKVPLDISFLSLKELFKENLTKKDFRLYEDILLYIDLRNIKALLLEKPFDPRGNLSEQEMREALQHQSSLPEYIFSFFEEYETKKERLLHYTYVYAAFFREKREGFLGKYFSIERSIRLITSALRAKKWGKDIVYELQFESLDDPLIALIIAQKDAKEFDPPAEFSSLKTIFIENEAEPFELERKLLSYRLEKIEEFIEGHVFSIDAALGYALRLYFLENAHLLQEQETNIRKVIG